MTVLNSLLIYLQQLIFNPILMQIDFIEISTLSKYILRLDVSPTLTMMWLPDLYTEP
jgi:hypothetical protein